MREVLFGSYSMCATLAGTPSCGGAVARPCTFRPPLLCSGTTSDFSGSLRVISEKSEPLAPRRPGVVGLYLRIATCFSLTNRSAEDVDPVTLGQGHDRPLGVRALAPALPGPPALAQPVQRVHAGHPDPEHFLNRLPDLRLVGVRRDDKRVLALVEKAVALL